MRQLNIVRNNGNDSDKTTRLIIIYYDKSILLLFIDHVSSLIWSGCWTSLDSKEAGEQMEANATNKCIYYVVMKIYKYEINKLIIKLNN